MSSDINTNTAHECPLAPEENILLVRGNALLEEKIQHFPIEDSPKQVPGRNSPYETMLDGVEQHTIWHSGQIALVWSILRSRPCSARVLFALRERGSLPFLSNREA